MNSLKMSNAKYGQTLKWEQSKQHKSIFEKIGNCLESNEMLTNYLLSFIFLTFLI